MSNTDRVRADQERRRSSAARPIPAGKHKKPRTAIKQALRKEYR